jgi:hypothetical protein
MTKQVQRRRGTATQHTSFTGADGEISVNTTNKSIHVHDGVTTSGFEAARIDLTNVTGATVAGKVTGSTLSSLTITSADINGGTIDSTAIGNTTPSSGIFTTLSASSTLTLGGTAVTSTAAELNILDGVTSTAAELNILDGVTATAAELNYNDITTLGTVQASKTVTANASGDVLFPDGDKAIFGAGSDLQIYHDGNNSYISEQGTGSLIILTSGLDLNNAANTENMLTVAENGAVTLFHNNAAKLATTSTGIDVTGTVTADGLSVVGGPVGYVGEITNISGAAGSRDGLKVETLLSNSTTKILTAASNSIDRFVVTGEGNVGIGTSSPDVNLSVFGSAAVGADVGGEISIGGFYDGSSKTSYGSIAGVNQNGTGNTSGQLLFKTRTNFGSLTERMRIDSSGNTMVGVTPAQARFTVGGAAATAANSTICRIGNDAYGSDVVLSVAPGVVNFDAPGVVGGRVKIDSSGNLLVGTTSTIPFLLSSGTGAGITSAGTVMAGATAEAGLFNRIGSDGSIVNFYKAGAIVGNIGTQGGDLNIGTGACGIAFVDGVPAIYPWTTTGNTTSDAAIDLGDSAGRFKDLYLSGGVYLGGTGAANHLDDYEESVFVLTVNQGGISINTDYDEAFYTKVGRVVTVSGLILATSSGDSNVLKINLPFVAATRSANQTDYFIGSVMSYNVPTGTGGLVPYIAVGTDKLVFQKTVDNGVWSSIVGTELASGDHFYFTITYQTN